MGNILYSLTDYNDNQMVVLISKIEALEEDNQELEARVNQLERRVEAFLPSSEADRDVTSGIDFKSIDKFVEKFMKKNPVDIGKVKPLQIPGLKNFEIDLMPPSVEKHLYSNIISLLLGFFDDEIQMDVANHRIRTIVSRVNKS